MTISDLLFDKKPAPNEFTIGFGELVRHAREAAGLSQTELASRIGRRQATISDIERGKSEVSIATYALLAAALDRPLGYFLPPVIRNKLEPADLSLDEMELIAHFRKIANPEIRRFTLRQMEFYARNQNA